MFYLDFGYSKIRQERSNVSLTDCPKVSPTRIGVKLPFLVRIA